MPSIKPEQIQVELNVFQLTKVLLSNLIHVTTIRRIKKAHFTILHFAHIRS